MALRISLGLLLFWRDLDRIVSPDSGAGLQKHFYFGLFPGQTMQMAFGYLETGPEILVIAGLWRRVAVPAQLVVTGFSAATIWSALLDPFALWLPVAKLAPVQHLFYPSVIALCGAFVLLAFRAQNRWALDVFLSRNRLRRDVARGE